MAYFSPRIEVVRFRRESEQLASARKMTVRHLGSALAIAFVCDPKSEALGFESAAENPNRSSLDLKVSRLHSRELASDLNRRRSIQTDDIPFKTSAGNPKQIAFWVKSPL